MFQIKDNVENVVENIEEIAHSYYRLTVVNAVDKGSKIGSSLIINVLVIALGFFVFLFAGFGASYWIGEKLGDPMLGFFIVAGFLLLVLLIILALKGKVIQPFIRNIIIKNLYD